jgi:hypothetical protein
MRRLGGICALGLIVAVPLALTGCGGGSAKDPAPTTIAPSPAAPSAAGSDAYLDNVRDESLGVKGLPNATDDQLLQLGTTACHDLSAAGGTATGALQSLMSASLHPDSADANAVLQAAVGNLCPDQADKAPAPSAVDSGH